MNQFKPILQIWSLILLIDFLPGNKSHHGCHGLRTGCGL